MIERINQLVYEINNAHEEALVRALEQATKDAKGNLQTMSTLIQNSVQSRNITVSIHAYDTRREVCLYNVRYRGRKVLGLSFYQISTELLSRIRAFAHSPTLETQRGSA